MACGRELTEPGGLVFSPPLDDAWTVRKLHVCVVCFPVIEKLLTAHIGASDEGSDSTTQGQL